MGLVPSRKAFMDCLEGQNDKLKQNKYKRVKNGEVFHQGGADILAAKIPRVSVEQCELKHVPPNNRNLDALRLTTSASTLARLRKGYLQLTYSLIDFS